MFGLFEKKKELYCNHCGDNDPDQYYTMVNPPGGYGRPQIDVCDNCMRSGAWDDWIAANWPTWPVTIAK